jgi:hypothetical protein
MPPINMSLDDVAVISRQISLALVGVIILSSMRLVLRGVTRVSLYRFWAVYETPLRLSLLATGTTCNKSEYWGVFDAIDPSPIDGVLHFAPSIGVVN